MSSSPDADRRARAAALAACPRYGIAPGAYASNWSRAQVFHGVMSSRRADARVESLTICADQARREARRLGSCTRVGIVEQTPEGPKFVALKR